MNNNTKLKEIVNPETIGTLIELTSAANWYWTTTALEQRNYESPFLELTIGELKHDIIENQGQEFAKPFLAMFKTNTLG